MERTTPAPSSTRRCLVTAWRVSRVPAVSWVIDCGAPPVRRVTKFRRVPSPSAANTAALVLRAAALGRLDMFGDVLQLRGPAAVVHAEGDVAALGRQLLEAGL